MLYPQINSVRELISLDGLWKFAVDNENTGEENKWYTNAPYDREIAVPASWNEQYQDLMYFFQTGWYEKEIEIPESFNEKLIWLRVGAANYISKVWINGIYIGEHEGAHLPFEFNITDNIKIGAKNKITISVDARIKKDRLPPGGVQDEQIVGFKGQYPDNNYDFFPYAGIDRSVSIYTTSNTYIEDIKINTDILKEDGLLYYKIDLSREFTGNVEIEIGETTATLELKSQKKIEGKLCIKGARLWCIEDPYLYEMKIILHKDKNIIDKYTQVVGIRTIKIEGNKLLLNKKPIFLKGFGMHEDFYILGKGVNHSVIVKDFNLLKWIGANSIRTSHYPYSEEFLNYADKNGILIIGETPFVGFVRSHYKDSSINRKVKKVIKEMIDRDKNHPSIIAWSLANEGDTFVPEADLFYKNIYDYAKSIDSTRPITITNCIDIEDDVALKHFDFISINRYYGWYEQAGRIDLGCSVLEEKLDRCYDVFKKPIIVTEFGADAVAGMHIDPPEQFSEEYQAEMVSRQYNIIKSKPYTIGAHIWAYADFKTSQTPARVILNRKGIFTRDRQPKLAAHSIRKIWNTK